MPRRCAFGYFHIRYNTEFQTLRYVYFGYLEKCSWREPALPFELFVGSVFVEKKREIKIERYWLKLHLPKTLYLNFISPSLYGRASVQTDESDYGDDLGMNKRQTETKTKEKTNTVYVMVPKKETNTGTETIKTSGKEIVKYSIKQTSRNITTEKNRIKELENGMFSETNQETEKTKEIVPDDVKDPFTVRSMFFKKKDIASKDPNVLNRLKIKYESWIATQKETKWRNTTYQSFTDTFWFNYETWDYSIASLEKRTTSVDEFLKFDGLGPYEKHFQTMDETEIKLNVVEQKKNDNNNSNNFTKTRRENNDNNFTKTRTENNVNRTITKNNVVEQSFKSENKMNQIKTKFIDRQIEIENDINRMKNNVVEQPPKDNRLTKNISIEIYELHRRSKTESNIESFNEYMTET